jgi:hypothetical protein
MFFPRRKAVLRRRGIFLSASQAVLVLMGQWARRIPSAQNHRFRPANMLIHKIIGLYRCGTTSPVLQD